MIIPPAKGKGTRKKSGPHDCAARPFLILLIYRLVLDGADGNAVPAFLGKHVADTLTLSLDAVSSNLVLVDEGSLHSLGTLVGETDVNLLGTILRCVTLDDNLSVLVVLEVHCNLLYVRHLVVSDVVAANLEEDVAHGVELVVVNLYNLGLAVLASGKLSLKGSVGGVAAVEGGVGSLYIATKSVDLSVESIDFTLIVGLNALEAVAEVVRYAGEELYCSVVGVVTAGSVLDVVVCHVPSDRGLDGDSPLTTCAEVEVEVKANLGCEIVVVAVATVTFGEVTGRSVPEVVAPACACYSLNLEETTAAVVACEEVVEINGAINAHILAVKSGSALGTATPRRGVHAPCALYAEAEYGRNLLVDVNADHTTHVAPEGGILEGGSTTTHEAERPVIPKFALLESFLSLHCRCSQEHCSDE